ncbi:hypothetical protein BT63DRAFT_418531 [Microthyrium microscopicum]|uniref:Uncharacterized protein n=1 Tax=Microthyrium microscopicum TaxID=703497 RepID=A0A6A6TXQ0_9PEZI|nr:hypothetical protein BT63DRAFT_418531 [Microthyrium microscopicum]
MAVYTNIDWGTPWDVPSDTDSPDAAQYVADPPEANTESVQFAAINWNSDAPTRAITPPCSPRTIPHLDPRLFNPQELGALADVDPPYMSLSAEIPTSKLHSNLTSTSPPVPAAGAPSATSKHTSNRAPPSQAQDSSGDNRGSINPSAILAKNRNGNAIHMPSQQNPSQNPRKPRRNAIRTRQISS